MVPDPETFQTRYKASVSNKLNMKQDLVFSIRGVCSVVVFFFLPTLTSAVFPFEPLFVI